MAHCKPEEWSLKELAKALTNKEHENKKIVVPMFQRRQCWTDKKEADFVDSLRRGFPVGAMLFYKTVDGDTEIYTLIDGLQRSNTVRKYMSKPTKFFRSDSLPDDTLDAIMAALGIRENVDAVKQTATNAACAYLRSLDKLDSIEKYAMAKTIIQECGADTRDMDLNEKIQEIVAPYTTRIKNEFSEIEKIVVPILVYTGEVSNLPEIFERINSKGVALSDYEVFAAAWPIKKFKVENEKIVYKIMDKYDTLVSDGYSIEGYDGNVMRTEKKLSAFEYLFGLSRVLNETYDFLHFEKKAAPDEINTMAYELVNTCLNESKDEIPTLYEQIYGMDVNLFEKRLIEAITYVGNIIHPITKFKGNKRKKDTIFHSKYQIISLIAYVFRKMYDSSDLTEKRDTWAEQDVLIRKYMPQHYVYDIITKAWNDGGQSKSYRWIKENRYITEISFPIWNSALNMYYENSNTKKETTKVTNPSKEDIVLLNCIHLAQFTAQDQLGEQTFDIEHLATKQLMAEQIKHSQGTGLPIGSIANICYLQEGINRSKGKQTIYQYTPIAEKLEDIERRFSFTSREDLSWIEELQDDFEKLKKEYAGFLRKRFDKQKDAFYSTMGIEKPDNIEDVPEIIEEQDIIVSGNVPALPDSSYKVGKFVKQAMRNLSNVQYAFTEEMIEEMCSLEWSKDTFGKRIWLPFLVPENLLVKRERYYKEIFVFNGKRFYLYSQWEINSDMRERFIQWYRSLP